MKSMIVKIKRLWQQEMLALMGLCLSTSCANIDSDPMYSDLLVMDGIWSQYSFPTLIRWEDEAGDNPLRYFQDIDQSVAKKEVSLDAYDWLRLECHRGSDGAEMTFSKLLWYTPLDDSEVEAVGGAGPMLYVSWLDMDLVTAQNTVSMEYDETYTLRVENTRLQCQQVHEIRWFLHVRQAHYTITRCEVDGVESEDYKRLGTLYQGFVRLRQ